MLDAVATAKLPAHVTAAAAALASRCGAAADL